MEQSVKGWRDGGTGWGRGWRERMVTPDGVDDGVKKIK